MKNNSIIADNNKPLKDFLAQHSFTKIFVLVDKNTQKFCLPEIIQELSNPIIISLSAGDENKNLKSCGLIWKKLNQHHANENSLLINLGGGMITDIGGFAASVYKRGIAFIHIPTSLMAMCDAAIGGKTAINFESIKNNIGTFNLPLTTFIFPKLFLKTLPNRQLRSGMMEILKHAILDDKIKWLQKNSSIEQLESTDWKRVITESVKFKQQIVEHDFKDKSNRKILNFGHTIGHAVESVFQQKTKQNRLLHGEAIAIGIWMELLLSIQLLNYPAEQANEIFDWIEMLMGFKKLKKSDKKMLFHYLQNDKKNRNNLINFTLLHSNGKPETDCFVSRKIIENVIRIY